MGAAVFRSRAPGASRRMVAGGGGGGVKSGAPRAGLCRPALCAGAELRSTIEARASGMGPGLLPQSKVFTTENHGDAPRVCGLTRHVFRLAAVSNERRMSARSIIDPGSLWTSVVLLVLRGKNLLSRPGIAHF